MNNFNRTSNLDTELQPQNHVYSDKVFRCNGDDSSLEECTCDTEFSGVCRHVNLSCYNPSERPDYTPPSPHTHTQTHTNVRACAHTHTHTHTHIHTEGIYPILILYITDPLSPIEVCLPANENVNNFTAVSKFTYTLNLSTHCSKLKIYHYTKLYNQHDLHLCVIIIVSSGKLNVWGGWTRCFPPPLPC